MDTIISAKNLSKIYQMGEITVRALQEATFEIFSGEFIVFLGPSGSGKSTLLNIIGGMDQASGGELYYKNSPLHNVDDKILTQYRRNSVGFVFQFYNLIPNLTAYENVSLSAEIANNPLDVKELLFQVGLSERASHFPSQLSGGEQQRVALARAVVKNPEILLCDEPTGALDSQTSIQVYNLLKYFCEFYKKTVIVITHNAGVANIADRVFHLKDGRIVQIEKVENPITPEKVAW